MRLKCFHVVQCTIVSGLAGEYAGSDATSVIFFTICNFPKQSSYEGGLSTTIINRSVSPVLDMLFGIFEKFAKFCSGELLNYFISLIIKKTLQVAVYDFNILIQRVISDLANYYLVPNMLCQLFI